MSPRIAPLVLARPQPWRRRALGTALVLLLTAASAMAVSPAGAATPPVDLGAADNFAVLAGSGITNTGPTTISGDVGTFPNPTETGFGSLTLTGTDHAGDAVTQRAKDDLVTTYDDVAGRGPTTEIATDLAGQTLVPGIYDTADGTFGNTGVLTLDGQGQTDPVFVFQTTTTLITGSGSSVVLVNGADACNVYWKIGSSATLGTASELTGNVLALTSITLTTAATLEGRALARNGAVTMDTNTINRSACAEPTDTTSTVESSDATTTSGSPVTFTATIEGDDGSTPRGTVEFFDDGSSIGTALLGADGTAKLTTTALSDGSHSITVVYLGAPGYGSSTSTDLTQVVQTPTSPQVPTAPGTPTSPSTPTATRAPATPATPDFTG